MADKIPTAEEFLNKYDSKELYEDKMFKESVCRKAMVAFAKLHVQAALKAAVQKYEDETRWNELCGWINNNPEQSISSAYLSENIK